MRKFLNEKQIELIAKVLQRSLIDVGVHCAALIDISGSVIVQKKREYLEHDIDTMAVLAAGNFCAVSAIAEKIGESDFSLLVHKGKRGNIYLNKVMTGFLLMTISGRETSVGILRMKVAEAISAIQDIESRFRVRDNGRVKHHETSQPRISFSRLIKSFDSSLISLFRERLRIAFKG